MKTTYTCVFYEKNKRAANKRLSTLRQTDQYPEIKAYIIHQGDNLGWRVLRKILVDLSQTKKVGK